MLHSVACISATTGEVLWVLGGRRNEFTDTSQGLATNFKWQHHANVQKNGMISIFDNAKWMKWYTEIWDHGEISRGLLLSLDTTNMTAELVKGYTNPALRGSPQQGSMQILEGSGNVVIGWGYSAAFTEFSQRGEILCDTHVNPSLAFSFGLVHSYRAFRATTWIGRPKTSPAIYMRAGDDHAFVSWLGSTETTHWILQTAKDNPDNDLIFTNSTQAARDGFETLVKVPHGDFEYIRIVAADKHGQVLATTKIIRKDKGTAMSRGHLLVWYVGVMIGCCILLSLLWRRRSRGVLNVIKQGWNSSRSCISCQYSRLSGRRRTTEIEYQPLHAD